MSQKIILGIIGEMAAGKTTVAEYLKTKHGAVTFRFSDMLRDVIRRLHLEESRGNLQQLSTVLRREFGEDLLSKVLAADAASAPNSIIITEGIRRPTDITYLERLPGFHLLYLKTDERLRYNRLVSRSENADDKSKSWEQFQTDGRQESEQEIQNIASRAEVVIDNNGAIENTYQQLDAAIKKFQHAN